MASLDYRLNPIYTIKECSSYGSLYNKERCCSKGGFVDKFVHDSNKAPDSPPHPHTFSSNQRHCFHCKEVLGDGEFCQRCTCMRCGSGLSKGLCLICASRYGNNPNSNSLNDSPNISENVSQSPPLIDYHCCYECEEPLDGFFCQQCTCKSCGNGAHYGYNCPPKVPTISNLEPCHNQNVDEFPQTLPSFHLTCYSGDGSSFTYDSTPNFVDDSPNVFNPPSQPPTYSHKFCGNDAHYDLDCTPKNDRFNTESYLYESLLNRDTLMASSPKIDSLLDEFADELITIPPRIVNREHKEYISLMERLVYDNSSPRPPEDFHANPNTIIESLPTFPIPVEDSDSLREEIDIFHDPDDSIPPGIESDD
ncbi:hypothetical protein Tco_1427906 [Tanacetum coccineum]